jgi:hypothetical protein
MSQGDYDIGHSKPPAHTRWSKGQSGNRKGRPRGSKNTLTILNTLANEEIKTIQNGRDIKISKKTAALTQAINKAAQGDLKTLKTLLPHLLSADEKAEGKLDVLNVDSPKFATCFGWFLELVNAALMETPGIDKVTKEHFFGLFAGRMSGWEQKVDKTLNAPDWKPEKGAKNPLMQYTADSIDNKPN